MLYPLSYGGGGWLLGLQLGSDGVLRYPNVPSLAQMRGEAQLSWCGISG
jgi:hypothetical protein